MSDEYADIWADAPCEGIRISPRWGVFAAVSGYRVAETDLRGQFYRQVASAASPSEAFDIVKELRKAEALEHCDG